MFFKLDVLKNFTNFIEKRLCWSLFLIKLQACNLISLIKDIPTLFQLLLKAGPKVVKKWNWICESLWQLSYAGILCRHYLVIVVTLISRVELFDYAEDRRGGVGRSDERLIGGIPDGGCGLQIGGSKPHDAMWHNEILKYYHLTARVPKTLYMSRLTSCQTT